MDHNESRTEKTAIQESLKYWKSKRNEAIVTVAKLEERLRKLGGGHYE